jgi:hypothetical protein
MNDVQQRNSWQQQCGCPPGRLMGGATMPMNSRSNFDRSSAFCSAGTSKSTWRQQQQQQGQAGMPSVTSSSKARERERPRLLPLMHHMSPAGGTWQGEHMASWTTCVAQHAASGCSSTNLNIPAAT